MITKNIKKIILNDGIIIDHIIPKKAVKIAGIIFRLLETNYQNCLLSIVINIDSNRMGKKDILLLDNISIDDKIKDIVATISPSITINTIKNQRVINKQKKSVPVKIMSIVKCKNQNCITNHDKNCQTIFCLSAGHDNCVVGICQYCEHSVNINEDTLLL